jgi:ribosomal protein L11 methyltransferase
VIAAVAADCLGLEELESGAAVARVRIYWDSLADARRGAATIRALLRNEADSGGECRAVEISDGRWVERYQAGLEPFSLGRRFLVVPGETEGAASPRIALRLVPGRAFGTGEHATTQLCAEALEERVSKGSAWLDLGTGSGILALVAVRCGAARVQALDLDPDAIEVASEVVRTNGVSDRVELRCGTTADADPGPWDGVVANVEVPFFLEEAPALRALLAPSGLLIASGIPLDDAPAVVERFRRAGLGPVGFERRDGWCVVLQRRTPIEP